MHLWHTKQMRRLRSKHDLEAAQILGRSGEHSPVTETISGNSALLLGR